MGRRSLVVAAMVAGLCAPTAAWADHEVPAWCVPAPVGTVGLHAQVGTQVVHVPAVTGVALCVEVASPEGQSSPHELSLYLNCGFPCFRVVIDDAQWTVASTRVRAYLTYQADAVPTVVPLVDEPVVVDATNPNRVCLAVGNPIPTCPWDSVGIELTGL